MNQFDTGASCIFNIASQEWAAVDFKFSGSGADKASQYSGESRLSGAVLADNGVDFSTFEDDADIGERNDGTISNGYIIAFKYWRAGLVHSSMFSSQIRALC